MRRFALVLGALLASFALTAQAPASDPVLEAHSKGDLAALRRYAEAGDVRAQKLLVIVYDSGALGAPVDFAEAFKWERMAASQGDADSAARVGFEYLYGEKDPPVPKDPKQAVTFLTTACNGGKPRACEALAALYMDGDTGVPRDPAESLRWRVSGWDAADMEWAWNRGTRYSLGYDKPPKDPLEGLLRLRKAVETTADPMDLFCLGLFYLRGLGGFPKDSAMGDRLVGLAAQAGGWEAMLFLARGARYGLGVPKDPAKARGWLQMAASKGHPRAQAWLGEMLVDGEGGPKDFAAAEPLLLEAQKGREPVSGLLYRVDIEKDYLAANELKRKPPIGDLLWPVVRDRGAAAAEAQYRDLLKTQPEAYDFSEVWLNYLGYRLLDNGRAWDAAGLFRLNAQGFPKSWNAWDSLAEAQAALGHYDEAIANYKKSLALNPENKNGAEQVARLEKAKAEAAVRAAQPADDFWGDGEEPDTTDWLDDLMKENADKKAPAAAAAPPSPEAAASEKALLDALKSLREAQAALTKAPPGAQMGPKATRDLAALNVDSARAAFLKAHGGSGPEGQKALQAFAEKSGFTELLAPPPPASQVAPKP